MEIEMINEYINSIWFAVWNIIIFSILCGNSRKSLKTLKMVLFVVVVSLMQILSIIFEWSWYYRVKVLVVIAILYLYGQFVNRNIQRTRLICYCVETYIFTVVLSFLIGITGGFAYLLYYQETFKVENRWLTIVPCTCVSLVLWCKYNRIQELMKKRVWNIIAILGAFLLFFQQLFFVAFSEDRFHYMDVLFLLIYFAMIYTVLMNLQHRHLTADNQRILDDNQRMSQEIHRSRDVIDVVSRVVATEDTIDPKLRQELADFCKSEKQEMFDPDLAASLIGDTGMDLLNALLRDKLCQCRQQEISFEVMIPGPIDTYVSDIGIGEAELLRVINDLVKNAVTAINKTDGEVREILLILAVGPSDCLELCVYDSGVPFPDFILERFGERGNTTTGTGNGLADTVNTLRTYDASIEIEAIDPGTDIYTKCVRICFDGKNEIHI